MRATLLQGTPRVQRHLDSLCGFLRSLSVLEFSLTRSHTFQVTREDFQ